MLQNNHKHEVSPLAQSKYYHTLSEKLCLSTLLTKVLNLFNITTREMGPSLATIKN